MLDNIHSTGLHFVCLQPFIQRGGTEVVFDRTTVLLESMGVKVTYISPSINIQQWQKPTEHSQVVMLPNKTMWAEENIVFLENYIVDNQVDLIYYSSNALHISLCIANRLKTRLMPWMHSMPFSELVHKKSLEALLPKNSLAWWKNTLCLYGGIFRLRRIQVYLRDLYISYRYVVLHESYKDQIIKTLYLSKWMQNKILSVINTLPIAQKVNKSKYKEIIYVGHLCPYAKQVTRLVDIWSKIESLLPDWKLKIYGTGNDEEKIRHRIQQKNLKRVELCGFISNPQEVYNTASILCLTSVYEGWPMVLVEAQNHGVIPVAFNCCSGIEAIIGANPAAGVLVPHLDHDAYANELLKLCRDDKYREQLRDACLVKRWDYAPHVNDTVWKQLINDIQREKAAK